MGLSTLKGDLFCPIRKKAVAATPEERVRVQFLHYLLKDKQYPLSLLAVEQELSELPHLKNAPNLPVLRRADIVCFRKEGEHFLPLLLVECKAKKLPREAEAQIFGYNQFVKAPFIALVSVDEVKLHNVLVPGFLPTFQGFPTHQSLLDTLI